jgi:hypothetical protein
VIHAALYGAKCAALPIALSTAKGATEIAKWHAQEQLRILEPVRDLKLQECHQKLVEFLKFQPQHEAATRDILRRFTWSKEQLDKVLKRFAWFFSVGTKPPPQRGGHPVRIVQLVKTL